MAWNFQAKELLSCNYVCLVYPNWDPWLDGSRLEFICTKAWWLHSNSFILRHCYTVAILNGWHFDQCFMRQPLAQIYPIPPSMGFEANLLHLLCISELSFWSHFYLIGERRPIAIPCIGFLRFCCRGHPPSLCFLCLSLVALAGFCCAIEVVSEPLFDASCY